MSDSSDEEILSDDEVLNIEALWHIFSGSDIEDTEDFITDLEPTNDAPPSCPSRIIELTPITEEMEPEPSELTPQPLVSEPTSHAVAENRERRVHFEGPESVSTGDNFEVAPCATFQSIIPGSPSILNIALIALDTPEERRILFRRNTARLRPILVRRRRIVIDRERDDTQPAPVEPLPDNNGQSSGISSVPSLSEAVVTTSNFILPEALRMREQPYYPDEEMAAARSEFVMSILMATLTTRNEPDSTVKKDYSCRICPACGQVIKIYDGKNPEDRSRKH